MEKEDLLIILNNELRLAFSTVEFNGVLVESRELIKVIKNLRLEIYPNDHLPAHFHIIKDKERRNIIRFDFDNMEFMDEGLNSLEQKQVRKFANDHNQALWKVWNKRINP